MEFTDTDAIRGVDVVMETCGSPLLIASIFLVS